MDSLKNVTKGFRVAAKDFYPKTIWALKAFFFKYF